MVVLLSYNELTEKSPSSDQGLLRHVGWSLTQS
jgi:hypothetical protein